MKIPPILKAILLAVTAITATTTFGQTPTPTPTPNTQATQQTNTKVDVIYTGRLLGYFRVPSLQRFSEIKGCPVEEQLNPSEAAKQFLAVRAAQDQGKTVLVGSGDNFSPQLEARVFSDPPANGSDYAVGNKELYLGSSQGWIPYQKKSPSIDQLREHIANGFGTIPNDNVACFLRRMSYTAIVPGKHDFYFGAERVRQFARFLAADKNGKYEPVQMLGANLVMKTVPIQSAAASANVKADRRFKDWPSDYPVLNLEDGNSVYPWFSIIKIQLATIPLEASFLKGLKGLGVANVIIEDERLKTFIDERHEKLKSVRDAAAAKPKQVPSELLPLEADLKRLSELKKNLEAIRAKPIRICTSNGHPNELPDDQSVPDDQNKCHATTDNRVRIEGNKLVIHAYLKQDKEDLQGKGHFSTLTYGTNYGLCTTVHDQEAKVDKNACLRFSTYIPFFYFPHRVPNPVKTKDGYVDPEPFAVKNNVAVFGVVEPMLGEQVGILNFGWTHRDKKELTTRLSAEDPAEALRQQLDYFTIKYPNFTGLKVLLAQMTPQRARALAARFAKEFQVVVASADHELATSNISMSTTWKSGGPATGAFLAVPTPYFNSATRIGSVHFGTINAAQQNESWVLNATAQDGIPVTDPEDKADEFWTKIKALPGCLNSNFDRNQGTEAHDNQTYLKWLVLCSMQQQLGADVALIQSQDLFDKIPSLDPTTTEHHNRAKLSTRDAEREENLQQMLDRLIWKGDLVTLIYVPGSALKRALDRSKMFAAAEAATLSLSVDKGRKLETLGVRSEGDEYFINELPLQDDRLYAVATTDYIGAGDTGYPDLREAARNPRSHPAAYSGELISISSLVCRRLFRNEPLKIPQYCLGSIEGSSYLDETTARQVPPYPPEGRFSRFFSATGLELPDARKASKDPADGLENRVQRRTFRAFSLKSFTIGFKDVDNNRTDQSLQDKFAGVPVSGVGSRENRTITIGLDTRFSYFADKHEFFVGLGVDYERQSTGDPTVATGISLNKNRVFGDWGMVWWRRPGRELPNFGAVFSLHGETQLERPFSAFNLNTDAGEQIRIAQKRGALALGRLGIRWQNRMNEAEIGVQFGREFRALQGFHFDNPITPDEDCLVNSALPLDACIAQKSGEGLITADSIASAVQEGRPRAGMYWSHRFSFPLWSKVKYEAEQDADFFFVRFHRDTTIDTRLRYNSKNSLRFMIWPNFSIGPTLELFIFQNKVNGNFLFQRTLGIETKINFDVFNRREKGAQIKSRE